MVSVLLVFLLFGVLQVAAIFYVRSVVGAAASDGARFSANAGVDPEDGGVRASGVVAEGIGSRLAGQVPCSGTLIGEGAGLQATRVRCVGRIRSIFLPIGAFVTIDVTGQSLREQP